MKALTVEMSDEQAAAIELIAKRLRMSPENALKVSAFLTLNTDHSELRDFRELMEDAAEVVLVGGVLFAGQQYLCGCEELGPPPALTPA